MRKITWGGLVVILMLLIPGVAQGVDDVTPPTVTVTKPANGGVYAQNATVKADYSCSDASGIAACVGTVANGASIPTQKLGSQDFKVKGYDNAGNKTEVVHTYTVVDQTKPVITISTPKNGKTYAKNSAVFANFTCYDLASDIASCTGTVSNGSNLPTGTTGTKTFTVNAQDTAGNTATKTVTYYVA
jgi:hypothetical protein